MCELCDHHDPIQDENLPLEEDIFDGMSHSREMDRDAEAENDALDEPYDHILEQQEREDFAQDGYFENMSAADMY